MIELESVSKVYSSRSQDYRALDDVSLSIEQGTSVAIVGKSGSGKSTLMHIMSGLDRPTSGRVLVDGEPIDAMAQKTLDRFRSDKIGFIFQAFFVQANETAEQNVALPLEIGQMPQNERKKKVHTALEVVGLLDKATQKARNLSGGQKQRLAIARAIVSEPRILFADEPTGNLDSSTGEQIEDLLFSINKSTGATLIVVTHDNELAQRCDRQITLKDGKVIKDSVRAPAGKKRKITIETESTK
jgi:putative ABC transport system ATP-binding protein